MGGHGGLNILPQKRWNVYRFDNIEKVRKDEEAAAKEEQLKREQARKRDTEFRLEQLRTARGLAPIIQPQEAEAMDSGSKSESNTSRDLETEAVGKKPQSNHINLFEGIKFFDIVGEVKGEKRKFEKDENGDKKRKRTRKEEPAKVVNAEDEKFRLGYGLAGKGVKLPWYMMKSSDGDNGVDKEDEDQSKLRKEKAKSKGKKTMEELREERLKRENHEKERVHALMSEKNGKGRPVVWDNRYTKRLTV